MNRVVVLLEHSHHDPTARLSPPGYSEAEVRFYASKDFVQGLQYWLPYVGPYLSFTDSLVYWSVTRKGKLVCDDDKEMLPGQEWNWQRMVLYGRFKRPLLGFDTP